MTHHFKGNLTSSCNLSITIFLKFSVSGDHLKISSKSVSKQAVPHFKGSLTRNANTSVKIVKRLPVFIKFSVSGDYLKRSSKSVSKQEVPHFKGNLTRNANTSLGIVKRLPVSSEKLQTSSTPVLNSVLKQGKQYII